MSLMHATINRLLDTSTPANRCFLAVVLSWPFFGLFWLGNGMAFFNAEAAAGVHRDAQLILQALLTACLLVNLGVGRWLWIRRAQPGRHPRATLVATLVIGPGYLAVLVATGAYTSGMALVLMGVLAVGLLLFDRATMLRVFFLCVAIHVGQDLMVMAGWVAYAPLISPQAFQGKEPNWWWTMWRNAIFYLGWLILLALIFKLFQRLDALHQQLAKLSYTDVLTGLANRRFFMERLASEARRQTRSGMPFCLILLDVDHFKRINDRHGHHAGDEVLRHLSQVLIEGVRTPIDQSARIGGEEFAVLLPDTTLAATEVVCRRIADCLRQHTFTANGEKFHLTVSMGVVECRGEPIEAALKQADRNLYKAKQGGRDRAVYSMAMEDTP
ncbi:MAG: GGDEF domain-containing protein [Rubrivivax sp.]|nr:MAG: GGDEF domain-containing protein [Rubrivivax sp.]